LWAASDRGAVIVAGRSTGSLERTMIVAPDAPPQVRRAFILLWVSVAIGIAQAIYETLALPAIESYAIATLAIILGVIAIYAVVVYLAARRRNWARYTLLVWSVGGLIAYIGFVGPSSSPGDIVVYLSLVIELVALYWLFTSPGRLWYRA
jgi:hypothetical protein